MYSAKNANSKHALPSGQQAVPPTRSATEKCWTPLKKPTPRVRPNTKPATTCAKPWSTAPKSTALPPAPESSKTPSKQVVRPPSTRPSASCAAAPKSSLKTTAPPPTRKSSPPCSPATPRTSKVNFGPTSTKTVTSNTQATTPNTQPGSSTNPFSPVRTPSKPPWAGPVSKSCAKTPPPRPDGPSVHIPV